jgi:hypothetical protein
MPDKALALRDWSASSRDFRLALHALREEEEELYLLLPRAVAAGDIGRIELEEWPVFEPQRCSERFHRALEEHFGVEPPSSSSGNQEE